MNAFLRCLRYNILQKCAFIQGGGGVGCRLSVATEKEEVGPNAAPAAKKKLKVISASVGYCLTVN